MTRIHPYANLFPMCSDDEIQQLAEDIRKNGLRQYIVIDEDEQILDGRNRAAACSIAGVEPAYEPFVGTDAQKLAYVVSANIHRRHLTIKQRSEIAANIATMKVGDNQHSKKKEGGSNEPPSKSVSVKQAAKIMKVSPSSVKRAKAAAKTPKPKAEKPPAAPGTEAVTNSSGTETTSGSEWRTQRSKAKKTAEALQRALSDLNDLKPIQWLPDALSCVRAIISQLNDVNDDPPAAPNAPTASIVKDTTGRDIPQHLRAANELGIQLASVGRELDKYRAKAKELFGQPGGEWLRLQEIDQDVRDLKGHFQLARYYTSCTSCGGKGCKSCHDTGWIPEYLKATVTV